MPEQDVKHIFIGLIIIGNVLIYPSAIMFIFSFYLFCHLNSFQTFFLFLHHHSYYENIYTLFCFSWLAQTPEIIGILRGHLTA